MSFLIIWSKPVLFCSPEMLYAVIFPHPTLDLVLFLLEEKYLPFFYHWELESGEDE